MSGFQSPITINDAMQRIRNQEYLLPAFQREYVWKPEQVEELFDSLMREYPISSMLFWSVKDESKTSWKFYRFLDFFREEYHIHNDYINTSGHKDFIAILDGQQRLTSLYLALFGHYDIHKKGNRWENNDRYFKISHLYFNLTQNQKPKNENVEFEFLWLDSEVTKHKTIYVDSHQQKWFKCGDLYKYETSKVRIISRDFDLSDDEEDRLDKLYNVIFQKPTLNFYLEEKQDPDKAVNIFIRINSGGSPLNYSDILFSIAIANWKEVDARTEINNLVEKLNRDFDFEISKDLILKGFLFLFHPSIKFQVNSFDKNFIESVEKEWGEIKNCFIEIFKLIRSFGFERKTLSSNNMILPILYYVYHNQLSNQIVESVSQKENREIIKRWMLRATLLKPFGSSSDTVLASIRKVFIQDLRLDSQKYFDETLERFPLEKIEATYKRAMNINEEFLESDILSKRKNDSETFAVLSLLYPNLDYRNHNFHKDHLYAESLYEDYKDKMKSKGIEPYSFDKKYDTLVNLQMLDRNENESKGNKELEQWVNENCCGDRKSFLERHLIPDINLSLENFNEFYEARKAMLIRKILEILN